MARGADISAPCPVLKGKVKPAGNRRGCVSERLRDCHLRYHLTCRMRRDPSKTTGEEPSRARPFDLSDTSGPNFAPRAALLTPLEIVLWPHPPPHSTPEMLLYKRRPDPTPTGSSHPRWDLPKSVPLAAVSLDSR